MTCIPLTATSGFYNIFGQFVPSIDRNKNVAFKGWIHKAPGMNENWKVHARDFRGNPFFEIWCKMSCASAELGRWWEVWGGSLPTVQPCQDSRSILGFNTIMTDSWLTEKSQQLSPLITEHDRGVAAVKCVSDSCLWCHFYDFYVISHMRTCTCDCGASPARNNPSGGTSGTSYWSIIWFLWCIVILSNVIQCGTTSLGILIVEGKTMWCCCC